MIVKICGIKTLEAALAAIEAGADMLGFNFYPPSVRYIGLDVCAQIVAALNDTGKPVTTVGIFVNEHPKQVKEIVDTCGLDLAQLAGDEPPEELALLEGKAFKAVRPKSLAEAREKLQAYARNEAPALLVDAHVKGAYGGTGETSDWTLARDLAKHTPILLAGGLNPNNVAAAVAAVRPWGVDVASGVESSPGVKEPAMVSAFIFAAR